MELDDWMREHPIAHRGTRAYASDLQRLQALGYTQAQMRTWLGTQGLTVSRQAIGKRLRQLATTAVPMATAVRLDATSSQPNALPTQPAAMSAQPGAPGAQSVETAAQPGATNSQLQCNREKSPTAATAVAPLASMSDRARAEAARYVEMNDPAKSLLRNLNLDRT